jgi:hypothetical protein
VREKKEAGKSRARFWEVAGSKMGKVTGAACTAATHNRCCAVGEAVAFWRLSGQNSGTSSAEDLQDCWQPVGHLPQTFFL